MLKSYNTVDYIAINIKPDVYHFLLFLIFDNYIEYQQDSSLDNISIIIISLYYVRYYIKILVRCVNNATILFKVFFLKKLLSNYCKHNIMLKSLDRGNLGSNDYITMIQKVYEFLR